MKRFLFYFIIHCALFAVHDKVSAQSWQWLHRMGGSNSLGSFGTDDQVSDMATDSLGNVYVCGKITNNADFDGIPVPPSPANEYTCFIVKYDCHGNISWLRTSPGGGPDGITGIVLDHEGHLYVSGFLNATNPMPVQFFDTLVNEVTYDVFLAKFDTSGNMNWMRAAGPGDSLNFGAIPNKIALDSKGNINMLFETGFPGLYYLPNHVLADNTHHIAKFDTAGNLISIFPFAKRFGSLIWRDYELDSDDNHYMITYWRDSSSFLLSGQTVNHLNPDLTKNEFLIIKLDSAGTYSNVIQIADTSGLRNCGGFRLNIDSSDNVIATGSAPNGLILGNDTIFNPMNPSPTSGGCGFVSKISPSGIIQWTAQNYGTITWGNNGGVTFMENGNIAIAGLFRDTIVVGNDTLKSTFQDVFIAELDDSGNWIKSEQIGCNGDVTEATCITSSENNILVAGLFKAQISIPGTTLMYGGGKSDGFVAKYGNICTTGIEELQASDLKVLVFPNPATDYINVHSNVAMKKVQLVNILGELVFEKELFQGQQTSIQVMHLTPGIYIARIFTDGGIISIPAAIISNQR